ncbi:MAG TPA: class IV adenylate cyclase [Solirubrobacteraceae bacterium]|nr:class IV adenylate cyclase [Solirubrobacteraceae bacterium]
MGPIDGDGVRRNIELKAVDPAPARSVHTCRAIGAEDAGVIHQLDTYFAVPHGRLKLRVESPGRPHLLQYERADRPEARQSAYRIVALDDGDGLREALAAALGVVVTVEKRRRLFLWRQVRIHLDEVAGLGSFIELEAVAPAGSDLAAEHSHVAELRGVLGITDARLCASGYAAQLIAAQH